MKTKAVVMLLMSGLVLTLLGSAHVPVRVVSANNTRVVPGFPAFKNNNTRVVPGFPAFKNNNYTLATNWFNQYWSSMVPLMRIDNCLRDKYAICMKDVDGKSYNQPVLQATDGIYSLLLFEKGGSSTYFKRAEAEANRILSYKTGYDGAWWYPYKFNFVEYGQPQYTEQVPWYSAFAQGQALDLFTQLYKVTGAANWKADAERTFTSFLDPWTTSKGTKPWVDIVDSSGYLWLEEYPTPNHSDDTINGANFAIWALVDYANEFQNSEAASLASGALTTMLHAASIVRHPGWISGYSLSHPNDESAAYHVIVTLQYMTFAEITGASAFAHVALEFASDFPLYPMSGQITLLAGPQQMARVISKTLQATSVSAVQVPATTQVDVSARVKLANEPGYWYEITGTSSSSSKAHSLVPSISQRGIRTVMPPLKPVASFGPYAGLYVREQPGVAYSPDICNEFDFTPSLQTMFPGGNYTVYTSNGQVLTKRSTFTLTSPEVISVENLETIGGITVWAVSDGSYDGAFITGPVRSVA